MLMIDFRAAGALAFLLLAACGQTQQPDHAADQPEVAHQLGGRDPDRHMADARRTAGPDLANALQRYVGTLVIRQQIDLMTEPGELLDQQPHGDRRTALLEERLRSDK